MSNGLETNLWQLPATELAAAIRAGSISAREALDAHLERIATVNPELNAVVSLDHDLASRRADELDAAHRNGEPAGPLHGVPITLKDAIDVAGLRSTVGTYELDRVPEIDSTVASRLRAAGANIIGHTNVPSWLADHQTTNPVFGTTSNPWDLNRTAGGSSGGAAAAVAAGMTSIEVGSDMVGSIRLPAAFNGIYGLKTTEHRVPTTGFFFPADAGPSSVRIINALGPMARGLDDLETVLGIIAGPDDHTTDTPPVLLDLPDPIMLHGLRVAVSTQLPGTTVADELQREISAFADRASNAGATITTDLPDFRWDDMYSQFGPLVATITGVFNPFAELPDEHRTLAWYLTALAKRDQMHAVWASFFRDVDVLVCPAAADVAFTHQPSGAPVMIDDQPAEYGCVAAPHILANMVGLPALVTPNGRSHHGLPTGIQLIGPAWSDTKLVAIARALERAGVLPGFQPPPTRLQR